MRHASPILGPILFLCLTHAAAAQEAKPFRASFDGPEVFSQILRVAGLKPIQSLDGLATAAPGEALLVVFGDLRCLDDDQLKWTEFLDHGGAMLLACDGPDENRLFSFLQVRISAIDIRQEKAHAYRGKENCPVVHLESTLDPAHPLMRRIAVGKGLATNGPSDISRSEKSRLVKLAEYPKDCWRDEPKGDFGEPKFPMVGSPAAAGPSGRALVLAGPGVFFNSMLLADDNVNFQFAWNCVHWLREGVGKERTRVLFVNDGKVVTSFGLPTSFKSPMPGQPPIPAAVLADRLLRLIEQERILQQILEGNFGLNNILQALLLAASAGLLFYGSWRMARGMLRVDMTVPLLVEPIPPAEPGDSSMQLRQKALARLNSYTEPAQALARQWFFRTAGVAPMAWDEPGFRIPSWRVHGSLRQRWRRERQVRYARKVAMRGLPMNGRSFQKLHEMLQQLDMAIARKELQWNVYDESGMQNAKPRMQNAK